MIQKYLFLFLLFFYISNQAQTLTVLDATTQKPIEFASVYTQSSNIFLTTNAKGQVKLGKLKNASEIFVSIIGYNTQKITNTALKESHYIVLLTTSASPLNEVVVSASKWSQNSGKVPVKIETIDHAFTLFANPQTSADLLSASGSIFVQKSQLGGGSPMIRGFATNRVLMTVDGVRMNTAIFRGGNLQNVISLDPLAVGKTEIIFGPASVIYGSDAIGGVMNFQTLKPVFSGTDKTLISTSGLARYSTANEEQTAHADVMIGLKKWAFISSFTYSDFGNLRTGTHGPTRFLRDRFVKRINGEDVQLANDSPREQVSTGFSQTHLMQKVSFKPSDSWQLDANVYFSSSSKYNRFDRLLRPRGDNLRSAEWFYGPQQWLLGSLAVSHTEKSFWYDEMKLIVAGQRLEESRHDRDLNAVIRDNTIENVDAYSLNADFSKKLDSTKNLYYGSEYVLNNVFSTAFSENIDTGAREKIQTRYPDGSDWQSVAAYANFSWEVSPKLTLQSGVRYNFVSISATLDNTFIPFPFKKVQLDHGALTGSLGLTWRPAPSWVVKLNESTGFRSPNIDDIGKIFDSEPGALVVPNPDLDPEYAWNTDIGVVKSFGNWLKLDFTAFYTHLEDALIRDNFTLNGSETIFFDGEESQVLAIQNAAQAYVYGFQYGAEINFTPQWQLSTKGNYQWGNEKPENDSAVPLRHAAPFFTDAHLRYKSKRLNADLFVNYNAEVSFNRLPPSERSEIHLHDLDENGNPFTPSWYTLNLRTQFPVNDQLILSGTIENMTDQRYRPFSSGISAPGINFIFAVKVTI
ncbi:MAG: TonB-dependent receptor [Flavobacteriaceae bacterium]|nr:TonB-dependent receptor [Flavobacteriaceae bacterium]